MDKIKIAVAHRGAGLAPVFAAVEGGYYRENGLDVELVDYHGHPNSLKALIGGEAHFTNAVGVELLLANHRHNGDAVALASAIACSAQQIAARPGINTREDLRGKRWGVTFRNDADECAFRVGLERWGWNADKDIQIVEVGNNGKRLDLLLDQSKVDVAIMHAPETYLAPRYGYHIVEDFGRLGIAFQNSCAASTRTYVKNNPDIAQRYVKAFCQAVHRFRTDAQFGMHVIRKYSGHDDVDVLRQTWVLFARYMNDMFFPSLEGLRNTATLLHKIGGLPRVVSPEESADISFVVALENQGFFENLLGASGVTGE